MSALTGLPFTVMLTLIMRPPGVDGVVGRAAAAAADAAAAGLAGSGGAGSAGFFPLRNRENMHLLLFRRQGLAGTGASPDADDCSSLALAITPQLSALRNPIGGARQQAQSQALPASRVAVGLRAGRAQA
jgi:hypothetical protein